MMNIRNLGSQESVVAKYIDDICGKFCLKLDLKGIGIFAIWLSLDGFKSDPETKFQTITS